MLADSMLHSSKEKVILSGMSSAHGSEFIYCVTKSFDSESREVFKAFKILKI